jgi:hypothetical protein
MHLLLLLMALLVDCPSWQGGCLFGVLCSWPAVQLCGPAAAAAAQVMWRAASAAVLQTVPPLRRHMLGRTFHFLHLQSVT